ncbi:PAS [Roseovarius nubinhibens ISM]|uniref:histidine kinase n=1 Tax=Roseovarius nubinhibens (strain ATCC BAA-591 / DSM 15170 / ISM) TaxID=89187 RepID=A3SJP8_ROSNI|nr:PAS [Roseovarius nubinhibens ISM]
MIALFLGVAIYLAEDRRATASLKEEQQNAARFLERLGDKFDLYLHDQELRARGVATALELDESIDQTRFTHISSRFTENEPAILNLAYLMDGRIELVHPYESNKQVVGIDLRERPLQYAAIERVQRTGMTEYQGPLILLQGQPGVLVRMPVSPIQADGEGTPVTRVVSLVLDAEALLEAALAMTVMENAEWEGYRVAIRSDEAGNGSREVVIGDAATLEAEPLSQTSAMKGMALDIYAAPMAGWGSKYEPHWETYVSLFIMAAMIWGAALGLRQQNLERRRAQVQLKLAVDSLSDGFILLDEEYRMVLFNQPYLDLHDKIADAIKPGVYFKDILALGIERGQFPDAVGREEEWLAEQLKPPGEDGNDFEVAFSGGRWVRIYEKGTPNGGLVGLRSDITRQVETRYRAEVAEQLAQKSKDLLMTAIETLPDAFVLYDAEDRLVVCNRKYKEFYKKSAEAMVPGARFVDILRFGLRHGQYPEALGREEEWLADRMASHRAADDIIEQQLDDGRCLRILERPTPDGGRVSLRMDVTELVQSRARAEQAERRLRDAINAMPAGFWLTDGDRRLTMFNDYYLSLYEKSAPAIKIGVSEEDVVAYGLERGEYPEAVGREEEWLAAHHKRMDGGEYQWEYPLQNGRWVRSYSHPTSDGGRVGIRVDITELKKQETQLLSSNEKLRTALSERDAAEKRFSDVAEISNDWFWEQDADLRFTYISEGFERLFGGDTRKSIGMKISEIVEALSGLKEVADWELLFAAQDRRETFRNLVYPALSSDRQPKWIQISGVPFYDDNGNFAGYRGVGTDITVLYNALQEAEAANVAKTDFLNVMSHELRTPLTVILGYNSFLAKPELLTSVKELREAASAGDLTATGAIEHLEAVQREVGKYAGKMEDSGKHLLKLINEMLDLAKIDAGKLKIDPVDLELERVVRSVLDQFSNAAHEKSVDLVGAIGELSVFADEMRLRQILINLVGNALKFTDKGQIRIEAEVKGADVAIHVRDSGCGIPAKEQALIFDQFNQIDSSASRAKGGTGLGLTISRRLVELQGGRISVTSEEGKGSVFTFTLPMEERKPSGDSGAVPTKVA